MAIALSFAAWAQPTAVSAPLGFKVGDGRLHLTGDVDSRFDSLVGRFSSPTANDAELIFTPRASANFGVETPSTMVKLNGSAEYLIFSGILTPQSTQLSRLQAQVGLDTEFNRESAVSVQVGDTFTRSDRTQNAAVGIGVTSLLNSLYLAVPIRPGGRALEFTPRVTWGVEFFEPLLTGLTSCTSATDITCNPALLSAMNYSNLNFALAARYKFLPKTAVVFDANFDLRTYWNAAAMTSPPANILRGRVGLVGLITPRISLTLLAGAAYDFGVTRAIAPIGQAELTYLVGDSTSVSLGYTRDLLPVPAFGAFTNDRGYLSGRVGLLQERLVLNAVGSVDAFGFLDPSMTPGLGTVRRNDLAIGFSLGPTVNVTSWFAIGATYGLSTRSSTQFSSLTGINFVRHEANLRLSFRY
ncbi:MAG: hypothetical protein INH41_15780 [Myxococcaceae bacterium]|nr:hypothetical protein [Myxococcaceae bacterium]MCA3013840.1 hypothetical protein [Myxococcaceae bacterium]